MPVGGSGRFRRSRWIGIPGLIRHADRRRAGNRAANQGYHGGAAPLKLKGAALGRRLPGAAPPGGASIAPGKGGWMAVLLLTARPPPALQAHA